MAPSTIGLTIIPNKNPKPIQSLFRGSSSSGLINASNKKIKAKPADTQALRWNSNHEEFFLVLSA